VDRQRLQGILATVALFESWGVAVFPGPYGEKGTRLQGWPAMPVEDACKRARAEASNALGRINLAVRTGPTSRGDCLGVIDLDGRDGIEPDSALSRLQGLLPEDVPVSSSGRGYAVWFTVAAPVGNGILSRYGADIFTDVHLVNIPPSKHPSGKFYEWVQPPGGHLP
jgi:Bifunctional DNA primase/polymerase, N-terminal